jgi:hypothetical protein
MQLGRPVRKAARRRETTLRLCSHTIALAGLLLAAISPAKAGSFMAQTGGFDCHAAAQIAEREAGLPPGLLLAIGQVETGRTDPATGRIEPWSWSTNMAGVSHYFSTETEAVEWTAAQIGTAPRSIDVGCFQINLMYHPEAFDTIEQAFDPLRNARYAAQFLISLYRRTGSWQQAAEQYHSADPARGVPYGNRVLAYLDGSAPAPAAIIPASFGPRAEKNWVQTGPAVFGIQVFVPTSAKLVTQAPPTSMISTRLPSGGVLVMMPRPASPAMEEARTPSTGLSTRSNGSKTRAPQGAERNLPRVYTPTMAAR